MCGTFFANSRTADPPTHAIALEPKLDSSHAAMPTQGAKVLLIESQPQVSFQICWLAAAVSNQITPGQDRTGDLRRVRLTSYPPDRRCHGSFLESFAPLPEVRVMTLDFSFNQTAIVETSELSIPANICTQCMGNSLEIY